MFKKITAAIILIAFIIQTFSKVVIVVRFYSNQTYIAANLCENRNSPQMHCCGKCQLKKRLKQEDKNDEEQPGRNKGNKNELFSLKSFFLTYQFWEFSPEIIHHANAAGLPVDWVSEFFHPPSSISCQLIT